MKVFVGYATTEGQSRKIAQRVADQLVEAGHSAEVLSLKDAKGLDLERFDRAVLVASIHASRFRKAFVRFVSKRGEALMGRPTLFLMVSLAAAGHDAEDWRGLDHILEDLTEATGWSPGRIAHVAGAYKPSEYDLLKRFIMRRIIAEKDPSVDPSKDAEFTDWEALAQEVTEWMSG